MESIDKKTYDNFYDQKENLDHLKSQIALKTSKLEEENYQKNTLITLIVKMRNDLLINKKEIHDMTKLNNRYSKELEIQKYNQTSIKEKANNIYNKSSNGSSFRSNISNISNLKNKSIKIFPTNTKLRNSANNKSK